MLYTPCSCMSISSGVPDDALCDLFSTERERIPNFRLSPRRDGASRVFGAFRRLFAEHGLPRAIRSDIGLPFASPNGLYNLSKLSVWWLRPGIALERIRPGRPQQNDRDERMHLTLNRQKYSPAADLLRCLVNDFNQERPHEALDMQLPASLYVASARSYQGLPEIDYPFHDRDALVTNCGRICIYRKKIKISTVQKFDVKVVDRACPGADPGAFGSSASCTMIWDTSTWSRGPCKPFDDRGEFGSTNWRPVCAMIALHRPSRPLG
ncbi:hypothetical protein ABIA23_004930 [Sinorhizobium fredii]